ncbi:hypothetical protein SteCoe_24678 [Stentor coeruleus]|uniref:Uncharacterized protein n=1 Tax=Stentor coeruleus TaxID=5963 RepID=A0A1R2BGY7_9CILI|nr:hypothetical protein SteCoe_24678 [Stentor coeruleus]
MQEVKVVRSLSIDHKKRSCEKLKKRHFIRYQTPDLNASTMNSNTTDSPQPTNKYNFTFDQKNRKIIAPLIGEIYLGREEFYIISPKAENPPMIPKTSYSKASINTPEIATSFINESKKMFIRKRSYVHCLKKSIKELKSLNLQPHHYDNIEKIIPSTSYHQENSISFLKAIKCGAITTIQNLLRENPYLVHTYDNVGMTGLHWCALRSRIDIASILIAHRAIIDALDCAHRTPLFLAVKTGNYDVIRFYLINKADPFIMPNYKKRLIQYTKKYAVLELLKKAMLCHKMIRKLPPNQRDEKWKTEMVPALLRISTIRITDFNFKKFF